MPTDSERQNAKLLEPGAVDALMKTAGAVDASWMGPGKPVEEQHPEVKGRIWDFPFGYNRRISPRTEELSTFEQLENLSVSCELLRLVIERRKDQMESLKWTVKPIGDTPAEQVQDQIDAATALLKKPDGEHTFRAWQRLLLESMFVLDAPAIEPRYDLAGRLVALDIIDGKTITLKIDDFGRTPAPPATAYQQIFKGSAAVNLTTAELIYYPRNNRPGKVYGYSPVEQIIVIINTAIRRSLHRLEYYTEGSTPDMFMSMPEGMTGPQIDEFIKNFNEDLQGNTAERRKMRPIPAGSSVKEVKEALLKDPFDEWLARIIAFAFSIPPTAFVQAVVRAQAESLQEAAIKEGLLPLMRWQTDLMNKILWEYGGWLGVEFSLQDEKEVDPKFQAEVDTLKLASGLTSIDKIRERDGEEAIGVGPMISTPQGWMTPEQFKAGTTAPAAPAPGGFGFRRVVKRGLLKRPTNAELPTAESRFEDLLMAFFAQEGPRIAELIVEAYPEPEVEAVKRADPLSAEQIKKLIADLDLTGWAVLVDASEAEVLAVAQAGSAASLLQLGITDEGIVNQATEAVVEYARNRSAELVGMTRDAAGNLIENPRAGMAITDSTREFLRKKITQAVSEGMTRDQLRNEIVEKGFSRVRAKSIAQTELNFANSEASLNAWETSGAVRGKRWLLSNDHATRMPDGDICDANARQGVIPLRNAFSTGHMTTPAHPGCLCDVAAEVAE